MDRPAGEQHICSHSIEKRHRHICRVNIYPTHPLSLRSLTHPATYTPFQLRMPWYGTFSPNATAGGTSHCVDHYSAGEEKTRGGKPEEATFQHFAESQPTQNKAPASSFTQRASKPYLLIGQGERRASHDAKSTKAQACGSATLGTRPRQQSIPLCHAKKKKKKRIH